MATETTIKEQLSKGQTVVYYTVGVSMKPLLVERKTHVFIEPFDELHNNDIVLYIRKNGALVLHRLIRNDAERLYMRGDNTFGLEEIHRSQAIGIVNKIFRNGHYVDVGNRRYKVYVLANRIDYPLRYLIMRSKQCLKMVLRLSCQHLCG